MALSILYWCNYIQDCTKLKKKSEASVEVNRVLKFQLDSELRVINATVQASMRDKSYKVQIYLEEGDNGQIKSTLCECPLGDFQCHHIAAVLLFGYKRVSKTDVKCSWLKHPKSGPPKKTVTMSELYPAKNIEYSISLDSEKGTKRRRCTSCTIGTGPTSFPGIFKFCGSKDLDKEEAACVTRLQK